MTDGEIEYLYQKLGPEWVDHDPYINQAYMTIIHNGQPVEETLFTLVRTLAERARSAEDMLLIDRLKEKP